MTHSWDCNNTPANLYRTTDLTVNGKQTWDGPNLSLWLEERSGLAHKWSGTPVLNEWVRLAATYDAAKRELKPYVNGAPAGTKTWIPPTWETTGPLRTGSAGPGHYVKGSIDMARVWQGVLSDAEIVGIADQM